MPSRANFISQQSGNEAKLYPIRHLSIVDPLAGILKCHSSYSLRLSINIISLLTECLRLVQRYFIPILPAYAKSTNCMETLPTHRFAQPLFKFIFNNGEFGG